MVAPDAKSPSERDGPRRDVRLPDAYLVLIRKRAFRPDPKGRGDETHDDAGRRRLCALAVT